MKFKILGELTGLNEYTNATRTNRHAGAEVKRMETDRVFYAIREQGLGAELGKHDYVFTWNVKNRKKDPDNIAFAQKFIFDGLVKAGIIESDGMKHVGSITHNFVVNPSKTYCEVEII